MSRKTARIACSVVAWTMVVSAAEAQSIPAQGAQLFPQIAAGGSAFLVVWQDRRNGNNFDAYGAFVTPGGTPLGAIAFATGPEDENSPAVGYRQSSASFLVVWNRGPYPSGDIYGRSIADNGLLGPAFPVANGVANEDTPVIACQTNGDCVVAYVDDAIGSYQVSARIVRADGSVQPAVVVSEAGTVGNFGPQIVTTGTDYYVSWQAVTNSTPAAAVGARLRNTGGNLGVLDAPPVLLGTGTLDRPSGVATDGTNVFVAWTRGVSYPMALHGRLVSMASGAPIGTEFVIDAAGVVSFASGISHDAGRYLVTWQDSFEQSIVGRRFESNGTMVDPDHILLTGPEAFPANITATARGFGLVYLAWDDARGGSGAEDIYGRGFSIGSPAATTSTLISRAAPAAHALPPLGTFTFALALCLAGSFLIRRRFLAR